MNPVIILALAVLLDLIFGDPYHIPHPVTYIGKAIRAVEKRIRRSGMPLKLGGFLLLLLMVTGVYGSLSFLLYLVNLVHPLLKDLVTIYLLYTSLAAKCLRVEVIKVYHALKENNLEESRRFISYLVGRDTKMLDSNEITRAAVETTAESTVDGVLSPLFYIGLGMFLGIPVQMVFLYKTVNTLDSMVGYIQEPYKDIGFFSAKTDDILNYIPARLSSILMLIAGAILGYDLNNGIKILRRDRRNHKSPNCAYPEGVVAGLLNIQLGGTNTYFNEILVKPTIGDANQPLAISHIVSAIKIMYGSEIIMVVLMITGFILIG